MVIKLQGDQAIFRTSFYYYSLFNPYSQISEYV